MRIKSFLLFSVVLFVLLSTLALASSSISTTVIKNTISVSDKASFKLEITNNNEERQRYTIYSLQSGQGWNVDPNPLKDRVIEINPGDTYTTTIVAQPLEEFSPGIYNVHINVESESGERQSKALKIYLSPEGPIDYLPSIRAEIDMDDKIDPQNPVPIRLFLDNLNPLDLTNLKIKIQSEMGEFNQEIMVDLPPLEKKTVEFTITPNQFQQPKEYILFFVFEHNDKQVKVTEERVKIISLMPGFDYSTKQDKIFFKTFKEIAIVNKGNVKNTQEVKIPISFFQGLFRSGDGKVKIVDGQRYVITEVTLSPNESETINYVVSYRILIYILIILAVFSLFYWRVQSPVSIGKRAVTTSSGEDGALSEIKITLEVKNKTKKPIKDLIITDVIPGIANLEKHLEIGTIRPTKVQHLAKGTKVTWSLAEIDAHEHRLVTYKIKAKLNILGTFSLPRSYVEYAKKGKRRGKAHSNVFRLS